MPPEETKLTPLDLCHSARHVLQDVSVLKSNWTQFTFKQKEQRFMQVAEAAQKWLRDARIIAPPKDPA